MMNKANERKKKKIFVHLRGTSGKSNMAAVASECGMVHLCLLLVHSNRVNKVRARNKSHVLGFEIYK